GQTRVLAFNVQPDAALQSGIPFVRNQAGGSVPNASVSPFYIVSPSSTGFGDVSSTARARGLQGSLAISGPGANQQSVVPVSTGTVGQLQANGQPIFVGDLRGSSQLSATGPRFVLVPPSARRRTAPIPVFMAVTRSRASCSTRPSTIQRRPAAASSPNRES